MSNSEYMAVKPLCFRYQQLAMEVTPRPLLPRRILQSGTSGILLYWVLKAECGNIVLMWSPEPLYRAAQVHNEYEYRASARSPNTFSVALAVPDNSWINGAVLFLYPKGA